MFYQLSTKYICGIDLHAKTMTTCVMDVKGKIIKRQTLPCQVIMMRLRHKIAVAVYYMLKHDTVFDIDKFLATNKSRMENHAKIGTETSEHKSK